MGLLEPSDWKAEWIGYDKPREAAVERTPSPIRPSWSCLPPAYLRTTFQVEKPVRRATLYATALGIHDLHLNGQRVSDDYFNPGWTDYTKRVYYRAYDVTDLVQPGRQRPRGDPGRRLVQRLRRLRQDARPLRQAHRGCRPSSTSSTPMARTRDRRHRARLEGRSRARSSRPTS